MQIIKATKEHKEQVLKLLDEFRTACHKIINPEKNYVSTTARDDGGLLFDQIIDSPASTVFLAQDDGDDYIGIATINKIPQVRYGRYIAEIEEMYVKPKHQGQGAALELMEALTDWAKKNNIKVIRLESGLELQRAHGFYEKMGFRHYGRAYEKNVN